MDLQEYLSIRRDLVDKTLDQVLPSDSTVPTQLHEAMRYSIFAGGKRVRPILAMAAAEAVGGRGEEVLPFAAAVECVHTYSLIHDDLPSMDDDDMRRGKASAHKAFDEATAILAGDALLALAFEVLSRPAMVRRYRPERLLAAVGELADAAGSRKLVAGQVMDLSYEGKQVDQETVKQIMQTKTAALIRASLTGGALLAGGNRQQVEGLGRFGNNLGMVFQIKDDLLDLEGNPNELGKAVGKDSAKGKATFPSLLGPERARFMMEELAAAGVQAINELGDGGRPLAVLTTYVVARSK